MTKFGYDQKNRLWDFSTDFTKIGYDFGYDIPLDLDAHDSTFLWYFLLHTLRIYVASRRTA